MAVSIQVIRGLLEALEAAKVPRERFFEAAAFDPRRLDEEDGRLTVAEYAGLRELALDLAGNRDLLGATTTSRDAAFHAREAQAEKRIPRPIHGKTYAERVRELLLERGATERSDMNAVARALGLSARSLRRRLCSEGVAYNAIAEGALATLAKQLLSDEHRSIQEAAHTMGFSDPSAFYRAFKRWTGTTPKSYRTLRPTPSA